MPLGASILVVFSCVTPTTKCQLSVHLSVKCCQSSYQNSIQSKIQYNFHTISVSQILINLSVNPNITPYVLHMCIREAFKTQKWKWGRCPNCFIVSFRIFCTNDFQVWTHMKMDPSAELGQFPNFLYSLYCLIEVKFTDYTICWVCTVMLKQARFSKLNRLGNFYRKRLFAPHRYSTCE